MSRERKKLVYVNERPDGLFYMPRFLCQEEQNKLISSVSTLPFAPYDHHGYKANREVVYYGSKGGYNEDGTEEVDEPMPDWLLPLRDRCAELIGLTQGELARALIARYTIGAGIGWHRDRPQFGPSVIGISLASDAEMRFRRFVGSEEEIFKIKLERGSAYIIGGSARSVWQHGMNPVKELRYSITFRTIRNKKAATDQRHQPEQIHRRLDSLGLLVKEPQALYVPNQLKLNF